ncbi:hypothetical protein ACIRYZ_19120 [Kitasatospora sp. NPDC101155]|uniref:hypothetical protein n=1 Tax=Kitasatospora sp. NPDC101155 TaxID=3364097 RepID=UPI003807C09A
MLYRNLRRHCQSVVNQLRLPRPFSAEALCRQLAEQRNRPLHLMPLPPEAGAIGACGLWLSTSTSDFIFVERNTSQPHQEHIVLHEIGHMLLDHNSVQLTEPTGLKEIFSDLDPNMLRRFLARTNYTTRHEQEAEMLASLIRTTADESSPGQPLGVMDKLEAAMGVGIRHAR